jgi:hypothetical protein
LYLNAGVFPSELATAAPGIVGSITKDMSFIISRRFIPSLRRRSVDGIIDSDRND